MQNFVAKSLKSCRYIHNPGRLQMPKGKQTKKQVTPLAASPAEPVTSSESYVKISILAKPGAKSNSVTDIGETVGIQVAAPPVDGEANTELVKYLSKVLGVKKSQVSIEKGTKSRNKTVIVTDSNKEEVLDKLRKEMSQ